MNTGRIVAAILLPPILALPAGCASTHRVSTDELRPTVGERVRISKRPKSERYGDPIIGSVTDQRMDTLVVLVEGAGRVIRIPLSSVKRLEVVTGRKSKAGAGALVGLVTGAITGALLGNYWGSVSCSGTYGFTICLEKGEAAALSALGFGLAGAGLGALVGSFIKVDRWETIPVDELRIEASPVAPDGVSLSASLRFQQRGGEATPCATVSSSPFERATGTKPCVSHPGRLLRGGELSPCSQPVTAPLRTGVAIGS